MQHSTQTQFELANDDKSLKQIKVKALKKQGIALKDLNKRILKTKGAVLHSPKVAPPRRLGGNTRSHIG
jgi:hypothetical protein